MRVGGGERRRGVYVFVVSVVVSLFPSAQGCHRLFWLSLIPCVYCHVIYTPGWETAHV